MRGWISQCTPLKSLVLFPMVPFPSLSAHQVVLSISKTRLEYDKEASDPKQIKACLPLVTDEIFADPQVLLYLVTSGQQGSRMCACE